MASDEHKITAPIGVEGIEAEADGDERGLRIVAWAEDAWPDYVAVEDRITGRIRFYGARGGFDERAYRAAMDGLERAKDALVGWGAPDE